MKTGDLVRFLHWDNEMFRISSHDPNCATRLGIIAEIGTDYAGYELLIISETGEMLNLHETIHRVEIIS